MLIYNRRLEKPPHISQPPLGRGNATSLPAVRHSILPCHFLLLSARTFLVQVYRSGFWPDNLGFGPDPGLASPPQKESLDHIERIKLVLFNKLDSQLTASGRQISRYSCVRGSISANSFRQGSHNPLRGFSVPLFRHAELLFSGQLTSNRPSDPGR